MNHRASRTRSVGLQGTIILHDGGDVTLMLGDEAYQQPVLVSKMAMILASPVWKAMFARPQWAESTAREIAFPDDDVDAMLIALRIAHLRFSDLPRKNELSYQDLLALALLCDKYDLVKMLRPFIDLHRWMEPHCPDVEDDASREQSWLFIAWTFGYGDIFRYLALNICLDNGGVPNLDYTKQIVAEDFPSNCLESILQIRLDTLSSLTQSCYDILDRILSETVCKYDMTWELPCRAIILGSYIEHLIKNGLYPTKIAGSDVFMSVKTMEAVLKRLKLQVYDSFHPRCGEIVDLVRRVDRIIGDMPSPSLEYHRTWREEQTKK